MTTTPNPGSHEALEKGCLCPVLDNAHGRGAWGKGDTFWINHDCPLHGKKSRVEELHLVSSD